MTARGPEDILLISTADWDNPYWTNKQHTAVELARRGHRVLYVDSMGLRRPAARGSDLRRLGRRLAHGVRAPRQVRENLWVWSPLLVPAQGAAWARSLNRDLVRRGLERALRAAGLTPDWLWTYSPMTSDLLDLRGYGRVVYHAVDDVAAQPGMPATAIRRAEGRLARRADIVFATSPALRDGLAADAEALVLPNVCDTTHFARALNPATEIPADLAVIAGPRIGFIGAVSGYKLDLALLAQVARLRPAFSFVLIGEVGEGDPWTDISPLDGRPNVHLLGGRSYARLPDYLAGLDVALLPCPANAYTRAMFPMKFFEYLAAGRPVVSTPLPALAPYQEAAIFAETAETFAAGVDRCLGGDGPSLEQRLAAAEGRTYRWRTDVMLAHIRGLS